VGYLPSLAVLVVLFFGGRFLVRLLRLVFNGIAVERIRLPGFDSEWAWPTFTVVRFLLVVFLAVMAFPYLPGSASPAFQGVSIFLGVLVSFGSSGAVADVISGIVLTYTRAFHVGDRVKIADAVGDVVEKSMFVTRVRTPKNVDVTLPNALVLGNPIVNFSAQAAAGSGLILHPAVTIGYDAPWRRVHELLIDAARATEGVLAEPEPFVLQTALDDFYVRYELNVHTRDATRMPAIYSELYRNIQDRFHAAGVEIASPHLAAVRDGNQVQIPTEHLPKDYRPAAFRVLSVGRRPLGE
jgi:small-conductance mechanosensitive channel